jgi:hypothetical protein
MTKMTRVADPAWATRVKDAVAKVGNEELLAGKLEVSAQSVRNWLTKGRLPSRLAKRAFDKLFPEEKA